MLYGAFKGMQKKRGGYKLNAGFIKGLLAFLSASAMLLASCSLPASSDQQKQSGSGGHALKPIPVAFETLSTGQGALKPDFVKMGQDLYFNGSKVVYAENNPGPIDGMQIQNKYSWQKTSDGLNTLMILVNADNDWDGENYYLMLPGYGSPVIGKYGPDINVVWQKPGDETDKIWLTFQNGNDEMWVQSNPAKTEEEIASANPVKMAARAVDDGSGGNRFLLPLYAILNEVGGGILENPLGDGSVFIYSGLETKGYLGLWETSDKGDYRTDAVIDGKTTSISSIWGALELKGDGTFLRSDRYYQDDYEWVLTEAKGRYAFYGRAFATVTYTESEYRGKDYTALSPVKVDAPAESWGAVTGACVSASYIDEWDESTLQIEGQFPMYSGLLEKGETAPRPVKAGQ